MPTADRADGRPMAGRAFRLIAVDARSLRESKPFRRLWVGQLISLVGRQITTVAVPFQVYALTRSALAVGLLGIVQAVPLICGSIGGGAIADHFDRRRVLIVTQLGLASCSALLALGAFIGHPWLLEIYAVVALAALVGAVDSPTRTAIIPNLVGVDRLPGALSLNIVLFQTTLIAGPGDRRPGDRAPRTSRRVLGGRRHLQRGVHRRRAPAAAGAFVHGARASGGGDPAWADLRAPPAGDPRRLRDGPCGDDLRTATRRLPGARRNDLSRRRAGTSDFSTRRQDSEQSSPRLPVAPCPARGGSAGSSSSRSSLWGLVIIAFGFARTLWVALVLLAVAGGADSFSAVCRNTIMQRIAPDELRGRLTALYFMVVTGGPNLGDVETGIVANAFGPEVAIVTGGALCLVGLGAAVMAFPSVWRYRTDSKGSPVAARRP